ncbi:MAG: hypothetical protein A2284_11300 [Deltaproteobacteria bacterium RIFOXYA12_FULL_61_11]|nr:MAG: hypothetical protein A2284_11300 [Deltaproteobacteria bacterium RIFOXYA12_FULL_61_11]
MTPRILVLALIVPLLGCPLPEPENPTVLAVGDRIVFVDTANERLARLEPADGELDRIETELDPRAFLPAAEAEAMVYLDTREHKEKVGPERLTLLLDDIVLLPEGSTKPRRLHERDNLNRLRVDAAGTRAVAWFDLHNAGGKIPELVTGAQVFDKLTILDLVSEQVSSLPVGFAPREALFLHHSPRLLAFSERELVLCDLAAGTVLGRKRLVPSDSNGLVLNELFLAEDDRYLLFHTANSTDLYLVDLDPASDFRIAIISLSKLPSSIQALPRPHTFLMLYAAPLGPPTLSLLDLSTPATGQPEPGLSEIELKAPASSALPADNDTVYLWSATDSRLQSLDLLSHHVRLLTRLSGTIGNALLPTPTSPIVVHLSRTGSGLSGQALTVIDPTSRESTEVTLTLPPEDLCTTAGGSVAFLQGDRPFLLLLEPVTLALDRVVFKRRPKLLLHHEASDRLVVLHQGDNEITILSADGREVAHRLSLFPTGRTFTP